MRKGYIFSEKSIHMPSEKYSERSIQVIFPSPEECRLWLQDALKAGMPFSKYILEMARRGREGEAARPLDQSRELEKMREELARLRTSEGELRKLYEASEGELFRLRHSSYAASPNGLQEPSERLVDALQGAARPMSSQELLKSLNVDVRDIAAMKLLLGQLQALRDIGLLEETPMGWKWVK
jgi:hypothetical protein